MIVRNVVRHELRVVGLAFFRAFSWTFAGVAVLVWFILIVGLTIEPPHDIAGPLSLAVYLAFAVCYSVLVGLGPALAVGATWTTWRVTRLWTVVPLVLVPSGLLISWAAFVPVAVSQCEGWARAIPVEAMPIPPTRPFMVLLSLPILLYDIGYDRLFVRLDALVPLLRWLGTLIGILVAGLVRAGFVSSAAVIYGYWLGFNRRYPELF